MKTSVERVHSADGTSIALEVTGTGSAVVLIGGAFNDRTTTAGLAQVLAPYYRAVSYDRRGRGESGDESGDYSVDREMEDLRAVIGHLGGSASLVGHSSGAVLALEAAIRGLPVNKVAAYEPPYIPEASRPRPARDVAERLLLLVRAGDRDGATALFQSEAIGLPPEMVEGMRQSEMWGWFTGLAHSLPYDYALFEPGCPVPDSRLARVEVPTLVIAGSSTFPWLSAAAEQVAQAVPGARFLSLQGQDHSVLQQPAALLDCLREFLGLRSRGYPERNPVVAVALAGEDAGSVVVDVGVGIRLRLLEDRGVVNGPLGRVTVGP
jgi:pimeloyl-ACP methyl ester carboxylesterase